MSGKGSRFRAAGYKELKPFISVAGEPIISHILRMYPNRSHTIFVVNQSDPDLAKHKKILLSLSPNAEIVEIPDNRLGPSFAVLQAEKAINREMPIIVNYADFAGAFPEEVFLNSLNDYQANVLTYTGFHPHMLRNTKYAYVKKIGSTVASIQEKQSYTNSPMDEEASAGAYGFQNGFLLIRAIEEQVSKGLDLNGEYYTSLTIQSAINLGYKVGTTLMDKFYQWGTPEDLEDWNSWNSFIHSLDRSKLSMNVGTQHESIILAGGKGSRLVEATPTPKALFTIRDKQLWQYSVMTDPITLNRLIVRPEFVGRVAQTPSVEVYPLETETKGQAETASIALKSSISNKGVVSFLSCDNLIAGCELFFPSIESETLYVWTAKNYQNALSQPSHFSWVQIDDQGQVLNFMPKQEPTGVNVRTVIGNFTFSSKEFAERCLDYCLQSENFINGEPYLDSAIQFAIDNSYKVKAVDIQLFKAIGTVTELRTFHYWNECWERKLHSWV